MGEYYTIPSAHDVDLIRAQQSRLETLRERQGTEPRPRKPPAPPEVRAYLVASLPAPGPSLAASLHPAEDVIRPTPDPGISLAQRPSPRITKVSFLKEPPSPAEDTAVTAAPLLIKGNATPKLIKDIKDDTYHPTAAIAPTGGNSVAKDKALAPTLAPTSVSASVTPSRKQQGTRPQLPLEAPSLPSTWLIVSGKQPALCSFGA